MFQGTQHIQNRQSRSAGFTFVETLVAISILLLAVVAPLTLGSQGITTSRISRDQVAASLLAQEAIEYVRGIRDNNALVGDPWLTRIEDCLGKKLCSVSIPTDDIAVCEDETCPVLLYDEDTGLYLVSGAKGLTETKYTRSVLIEDLSASEIRVQVTVSWQDGIASRNVSVEDYLYDWQ